MNVAERRVAPTGHVFFRRGEPGNPRGPLTVATPARGFDELAQMFRDRPGACVRAGVENSSRADNGRKWDGGIGPDEMAGFMLNGWDAGNLAVADAMDVVDMDDSTSGGWDLDVAGEFVSIPDYVAGAPDCMMRKQDGAAPRRVRIVLTIGANCDVGAAKLVEFAKANAALVSLFMAKGYDVAVTGIWGQTTCWSEASPSDPHLVMNVVEVKAYSQEPDASRLAAVAHPAFFRRALFCSVEMDGALPVWCASSGYGRHWRADEESIRIAFGPDADGERLVVLPDCQSVTGDHESMLAQMIAMINDQATERGEDRI